MTLYTSALAGEEAREKKTMKKTNFPMSMLLLIKTNAREKGGPFIYTLLKGAGSESPSGLGMVRVLVDFILLAVE